MIVARSVFQAKYGKGDDLVALFKEARESWPIEIATRILTDASGPFFIVVSETEVESLAAWEQRMAEMYAMPDIGDWFARMVPLVDSGWREFYNIES
jgi:hypothetical protein